MNLINIDLGDVAGPGIRFTYLRPGEYRPNIYSMNLINIDLGDVAGPGVRFTYLWLP